MADDFDRAKHLFKLNEQVFTVMGVWPLHSTYAKFSVWLIYHVVHTCAVTADFVEIFGNFDLMVLNISENAWNIMVISKMLVMRFSRTLVGLTERVIEAVDEKSFENHDEKKMYLAYNGVAKIFFKLWVLMGIVTSVAIHIKPLEVLLRAYRTRVFFELDTTAFWIMWAYQIPEIYLNTFQTATIGYLFSLILHVCGEMSVLAQRIKNIDLGPREEDRSSKLVFQDIVKKHRNILGLVADINEVFNILLLEELFICTLLIGLAAYNVIVNLDNSDKTVILASMLESTTILLLIYGYCVAGEYLITESTNLYAAYYQCQWYEMSDSFNKQLIICMIASCKPIQLTGGGFYIFSLVGFTGVVKTAAGYISMLRAVI
ncbi:odorant receptor 49a-like [Venturia canescens]|uniref:odorant receptor 49a-like n=1 Tax=Venturia canescens TaxID=32260 RepID=UPI001C9D65D1|nr:odorant receptor 49a-like [Venturia canescens]